MENKTIKIAHIADCHLRVAQYGSKRRGGKFLQGVLSAVRKAASLGIKYILCSGDLLDASNPGPLVCVEQLEKLTEQGYIHIFPIELDHGILNIGLVNGKIVGL